jgi:translocation and assembly module TamA
MNRIFLTAWLFMVVAGLGQADELRNASRWDIAVKPYKYELQGELVRAIKDYRTAVNQTGIQPSRDRQLRAETDRLTQLLKSRGYYKAVVESAYDDDKNKPKYQIRLGSRYRIADISIRGNFQPFDDEWQSIKVGDPLSAVLVLAQQNRLKKYIEDRACYYRASVNHEVKLDEANETATVVLLTQVLEPASFAPVSFTGIDGINEDFLRRVTGISKGNCYKRAMIDNAVISLFDTGLFRQVRPDVQRDDAGQVAVTFAVEKRQKRTISASTGWESELGFGASVGWLHRDLFGRAQSLSLQASVQSVQQSVSAKIVVPSFFDRRNRLSWTNDATRFNLDSESYQYKSTASLERKASQKNYFEYGIGYSQIDEQGENGWETYQQIRVPLQYRYDTVLNPFNPDSGIRTRFQLEPVFDINDNFTPFIKTTVGFQNFWTSENDITLATRLRWGAIWYGDTLGSSSTDIPNLELYSAGGSTSLRGYAYQSIKSAQVDENGDAIGGTQRWLAVNELRARLNDSWGVVGFWDIGKVGSELSDVQQPGWYSGIGLGVRYYTRFAPIRLDVAVPLDKRPDDGKFLIYVSLGQAF